MPNEKDIPSETTATLNSLVTILNAATDALLRIGENHGLTLEQTIAQADQREREFFEANSRRIAELEAKRV
ncbi:MAG TPA: hypothetical protein VNQ79_06600 [Blastocatellia bacterium]|nr:hypothetical protein [Blastocatellia bacterium]